MSYVQEIFIVDACSIIEKAGGNMMSRLDEDRKEIDEIDEKMAALFEKRFGVVADVIQYKMENNLPILDQGREEVIIEKNCQRIQNEELRELYKEYFMELLQLSKKYQKQIRDKQ